MIDPNQDLTTAEYAEVRPPPRGILGPIIVTVVSLIVVGTAMYELLHGDLSTGLAEVAAGVALVSFGVVVYGALQVLFAIIETASERRRRAREVTERRHGERARKPR
jgi:hypothetical protein